MASIRLEGLQKTYGTQVAVGQFDLTIATGEFVVLVGPSGCGKTTMLRMIAGFVEPSAGFIHIDGRVVNHLPPRARDIGMVFQDYALFPNMTVRENIAFGLEEHGATRSRIQERVDEMLALTRMQAFANRLPRELSGGQQQRVALARALAYEPAVLLMDEPLGALDQKLREEMQREFASIQRRLGITTVFVTHDQQEAMALADRIVVMHAGRAEQVGSPNEIYEQPSTHFAATFIGRSNQFAGTVVSIEDKAVALQLVAGETVLLRTVSPDLRPGEQAVCVVRPEKLRPVSLETPRKAGSNTVRVAIRRRSYLGSIVDLVCETAAAEEIIVQLSPAQAAAWDEGESADLCFAPTEAFCFRRAVP